MSRLDVLLPHYRDVAGLAMSLASVAEQSWTGDMRLVIVDDGSPEKDFEAVRALAQAQDLPVTLERNPQNRGRPYTRNRLLDCVEGDYVAWLDAGDIWYPDKLALQFEHVSRLRHAGEDVDRVWITCHYDWQWEGQRIRPVRQEVEGAQLRELMLGRQLRAYLWTLLGTAAAFRGAGRFDERLPRLQDLDYFLRFVQGGGTLAVPPSRGTLCRYHKSDIGRDAHEIRRCNRLIFEKYRASLQSHGPGFVKTIRGNAESLSARYAKNNGDQMGRGYYLMRAFAADPRRLVGSVRLRLSRLGG